MTQSIIDAVLALPFLPHQESLKDLGAKVKIQNQSQPPVVEVALPIAVNEARGLALIQQIQAVDGLHHAHVSLTIDIGKHRVKNGLETLPEVKNMIAVASGKGGVGKSTTTVNLAVALQRMGARVGILDADLYGPSIPAMLGVAGEKPSQTPDKLFEPIEKQGLQLMSIGFLVDENQSLVWRGPLINQALQQLCFQTHWQDLDYLLIDLPPGTGDIQLTLTQKMPLTAALIVTTPQDIALIDAKKAMDMFAKTSIPVLGLLENMAVYVCPCCQHREAIFGEAGGKRLAAEKNLPLLGQLPLARSLREAMDGGDPFNWQHQEAAIAMLYDEAAYRIARQIAAMGKDYSGIFGKVVVENKG